MLNKIQMYSKLFLVRKDPMPEKIYHWTKRHIKVLIELGTSLAQNKLYEILVASMHIISFNSFRESTSCLRREILMCHFICISSYDILSFSLSLSLEMKNSIYYSYIYILCNPTGLNVVYLKLRIGSENCNEKFCEIKWKSYLIKMQKFSLKINCYTKCI